MNAPNQVINKGKIRLVLAALLILALPRLIRADSQWVLEGSSLTYHVSDTPNNSNGVSHSARGKGICHAGRCDFVASVPLNSFHSGSSHRDRRRLQEMRAAEFPIVTVRFQLPEVAVASPTIHANLQIELAGQTAQYKKVPFQRVTKGNEVRISGTIPLKLSDFKIAPPVLLAIAGKNQAPLRVDVSWRRLG